MLVEGLDVPAIDAVFLTQPTASAVRLGQMIGRGARLAPGKSRFYVVEFADSVRRHAERIFHARELLPAWGGPAAGRGGGRPPRHDEPRDAPQFEQLEVPSVGRLSFVRDQTFGVEIELTERSGVPPRGPSWQKTGQDLLACLAGGGVRDVHPEPLAYGKAPDAGRWYVTYDASAGWEVVSPVLANAEGFAELGQACDALSAFLAGRPEVVVNHRTGLHLTLGTRLNTAERLCGFLRRLQRLEPGLYTLTAPSRLYAFDGRHYDRGRRNRYCAPVREAEAGVHLRDPRAFRRAWGDRYHSVNVTHAYDDVQRLEVRLHAGTTEFGKIAPWVSLWMQVFNRARYAWSGPAAPGPVFPGGDRLLTPAEARREDLFELLRAEGIPLGPDLEGCLRRRRAALRGAWGKVLPLRVASWELAGWYAEGGQALGPPGRYAAAPAF
jgi:hypothetical protein